MNNSKNTPIFVMRNHYSVNTHTTKDTLNKSGVPYLVPSERTELLVSQPGGIALFMSDFLIMRNQ